LIQLNFWLGVGCLKVGLNELLISPLIARWGSNVARVVRLTSVLSSHSTEAKHHCEHPHWAMDSSPATTHPNLFSTNFKLCKMCSYISFNRQKSVLTKKTYSKQYNHDLLCRLPKELEEPPHTVWRPARIGKHNLLAIRCQLAKGGEISYT
jgi:hypothetical protein